MGPRTVRCATRRRGAKGRPGAEMDVGQRCSKSSFFGRRPTASSSAIGFCDDVTRASGGGLGCKACFAVGPEAVRGSSHSFVAKKHASPRQGIRTGPVWAQLRSTTLLLFHLQREKMKKRKVLVICTHPPCPGRLAQCSKVDVYI